MTGLPAGPFAGAAAQGAGLLVEAVAGGRLVGVVRGAALLVREGLDLGREGGDGRGLVGQHLGLAGNRLSLGGAEVLLLRQGIQQGDQQPGHGRRRRPTQAGDFVRSQIHTG